MIEVAAAWLLNEKGEVLICRRAKSEPRSGFWEFPGGKFESGEDGPTALRRELHEELDLHVHQESLLAVREHNYANDSFRIHLYACHLQEIGEPKLMVHDAYCWVATENLLDYNFLPADIPLIQELLSRS